MLQLTFNPGLTLTGFRTTRPWLIYAREAGGDLALTSLLCSFKVYMTQKKCFCSFARPLKIQKNGDSHFEISFFVLEILTFFYYAN